MHDIIKAKGCVIMSFKEIINSIKLDYNVEIDTDESLYTFLIDQKYEVNFENKPLTGEFVIYTPVFPLPENSAIIHNLLKENYLGEQTSGAVFSIDPITLQVVLFQNFNDDISFPEFSKRLKQFLVVLEKWIKIKQE